jgi:hypothetical protein
MIDTTTLQAILLDIPRSRVKMRRIALRVAHVLGAFI